MESQINELVLDIEELKKLEASAEREKVKAKLIIIRSQFQQELNDLRQKTSRKPEDTPAKTSAKTKVFTKKITTYAWDQSDKFIKIFVSGLEGVGDIPKDDVKLSHSGNHYSLIVSNLKNSNYQFDVPKLAKEVVDPTLKIKKNEVVIMLKKSTSGSWDVLSEREKLEKAEKTKKDDMKFDSNSDDPSKGIMDLMKKMYDEGDDDMKRTIAKAWTESRDKQMAGEAPML